MINRDCRNWSIDIIGILHKAMINSDCRILLTFCPNIGRSNTTQWSTEIVLFFLLTYLRSEGISNMQWVDEPELEVLQPSHWCFPSCCCFRMPTPHRAEPQRCHSSNRWVASGGNVSSDKGVIALANELHDLANLNLEHCAKITDSSLVVLGSGCKKLVSIQLDGCKV